MEPAIEDYEELPLNTKNSSHSTDLFLRIETVLYLKKINQALWKISEQLRK